MPHILVIDNFDSFTYNLVQYLGMCGAETTVFRNNEVNMQTILNPKYNGILLSPGPCSPTESGICLDIIKLALENELDKRPLFGVCLGHQSIGYQSGAAVSRASKPRHGKTSPIGHDNLGVFKGLPQPMTAVRYHSLAIEKATINSDFLISATAEDDGEIMGIRHRTLPIEGVQFHPESILTEGGLQLIQNFLDSTLVKAN